MTKSSQSKVQVFATSLLGEKNRVLGMLDRDENSRTFGSIDRVHWSWKFTDFPGARFGRHIDIFVLEF